MSRDRLPKLFEREDGPDRSILSLNDHYGAGVLRGLHAIGHDSEQILVGARRYVTNAAAENQYLAGIRDGAGMRHHTVEIIDPLEGVPE